MDELTPCLFEYEVEKGVPIIYEFYRDGADRIMKRVEGFVPYCYVSDESGDRVSVTGRRCKRVNGVLPKDIVAIRDRVGINNCQESDILYNQRYCIDTYPKITKCTYRQLVLDIETTTLQGFPQITNPIEFITCIAVFDSVKQKYGTLIWREDFEKHVEHYEGHTIFFFNNEKEMLENFIILVRQIDPDMMTGWWNSGFDIPYIHQRCELLGIDVRQLSPLHRTYIHYDEKGVASCQIKGRIIFDYLTGYKKIKLFGLESYSLDNVAKHELGDEKIFVLNIGDLWRTDYRKLIAYNKKDVELAWRIEQKIKIVNNFENIRVLCGLDNILSCMMYSRVIDTMILRMFGKKFVFPTKPRALVGKKKHIQGAFVLDPIPGIHNNTIVLDMRSLYPSIIKTFNLSMEMKKESSNCIHYSINGKLIVVDQTEPGVMPQVVDRLMENRKQFDIEMAKYPPESAEYEYWSTMYSSVKSLNNSVYGVNTYESFRMHDKDIASSVTFFGREIVQWNAKKVGEMGYVVPFGDTDSVCIELKPGEDPIKRGKEIALYLDSTFDDFVKQYGLSKHSLHIEFDKVYSNLLVLKKKRYIGHVAWTKGKVTSKMVYMGVASKRTDVSKLSKKVEQEIVKMLFGGKTKQDVIEYVQSVCFDILTDNVPLEQLFAPMKLESDISDYGSNLPRCRAATWANHNLGTDFRAGSKFFTLFVRDKKVDTDIVGFEDYKQIEKMKLKTDKLKLIKTQVLAKVRGIFEALGWIDDFYQLEAIVVGRVKTGAEQLSSYMS